MKKTALTVSALCVLFVACGDLGSQDANPADGANAADGSNRGGAEASETATTGRVDPREDGLEVALGEWAVTLEAGVIRPGRVTFVVANRGTIAHGFEIEAEDGDSSGPGSGDGLKAETNLLRPGETARLTLNLPVGVYKVECLVDGHDDLGMEGFLEVREDAPLVRRGAAGAGPGGADVAIRNFAFAPAELEVASDTEVTWTNDDPAPHTVTAEDGSFDSGTLEPGQTFSFAVRGNGPVTYRCEIHPEMIGTIRVG